MKWKTFRNDSRFVLKRCWTVFANCAPLTNERLRSVSARAFLGVWSNDWGQLRLCILKHCNNKRATDITDKTQSMLSYQMLFYFLPRTTLLLSDLFVSGKDKEAKAAFEFVARDKQTEKATTSISHTFVCCQKKSINCIQSKK